MKKILLHTLFAAGCVSSLLVPTANANLLSNGSFESPDLGAGAHYSVAAPTSWTGTAPLGYAIFNTIGGGLSSILPVAQDGNQYLSTGSRTVTQGFIIGTAGDFLLTWYDNSTVQLGNNNESYGVRVIDSASSDVANQVFTITRPADGVWFQRSINLTGLAAGNYSLIIGAATSATYFDNVVLDAVAVPEPSTYLAGALLALVCGVLGVRSLRSRKQTV